MLIGSCRIPARGWSGVLALCLLAAGCGRSSSSSLITETDSAGVRILTSHGDGWTRNPRGASNLISMWVISMGPMPSDEFVT